MLSFNGNVLVDTFVALPFFALYLFSRYTFPLIVVNYLYNLSKYDESDLIYRLLADLVFLKMWDLALRNKPHLLCLCCFDKIVGLNWL